MKTIHIYKCTECPETTFQFAYDVKQGYYYTIPVYKALNGCYTRVPTGEIVYYAAIPQDQLQRHFGHVYLTKEDVAELTKWLDNDLELMTAFKMGDLCDMEYEEEGRYIFEPCIKIVDHRTVDHSA